MTEPQPRPFHIFGTRKRQTAFEATDFLRGNERMAALLPAVRRMGQLQQDVARALPAVGASCAVRSYEGGVLVLAAPNAAVATRLKQQLSSLTAALRQRGWQIDAIRMKVQVTQPPAPQMQPRTLVIPEQGVQAFEALGQTLERSPRNAALIAAVERLAAKRR